VASLAEKPAGDSENFDRARFEQQVHAGGRLAGRYRLERELRRYPGGGEPPAQSWVGFDELLNRKVGVDLVCSGHPRARAVEAAARNAATVPDVHFVQVLDAADENGVVYVVKEWVADATDLAALLASGPLSPARATRIARELAAAIAEAHECDMPHGALDPTTVLVTSTSQVKILGLCLERALSGVAGGSDAQAEDVRAIGSLWYAALTGRWPREDGGFGLPGAPFSHGKPFSPAQIRAAVPKAVDQLVSQVFGAPQTPGDPAPVSTIDSAKALLAGITALPRLRDEAEATSVMPRAYPQRPSAYPPPPPTMVTQPVRSGGPSDHRPQRGYPRGLIALVVGVILVIGTVAAFELGGSHNTPSATSSTPPSPRSASSAPATQQLSIAAASIWDSDKGQDDAANLQHAYDGSSTGWTTSTYFGGPTIAPYRAGSGIIFDLGSAKSVSSVKFDVAIPGATVEVWTASSSLSSVPSVTNSAPAGFTKQSAQPNVGGGGDVDATFSPVTTRFVMVWFTALPHQDADTATNDIAGYRDTLSNVRIFS
jgi:serine/threonine protein kinase